MWDERRTLKESDGEWERLSEETEVAEQFQDIKVVGFDLDQTLYPKSPEIDEAIQTYLYYKLAEHLGCDVADAGEKFREHYQAGEGLSGSQVLSKFGVPQAGTVVQEALENARIEDVLRPDTETNSLLDELSTRYRLDLITGSGWEVTQKKLRTLKITPELFDIIITSDHVVVGTDKQELPDTCGKSNGEAYRYWLSMRPEINPEHMLYVGDRAQSDHVVPNDLGIRTVLVNTPQISDKYSCLQLPSLQDLKGYI